MSDTMEKPDVETIQEVVTYEDVDDGKEHFTHIVNPPLNTHIWKEGMSAHDIVGIARLNGLHVQALCGYKWVPKRNPEKYPACHKCIEIAGEIMKEMG